MRSRLAASVLALAGGSIALLIPGTGEAGNVGYYRACAYFTPGNPAGVISTAGHTKVDVATLDAGSLAGLDALLVFDCYSNFLAAPNPALNAAVSNGMGLVVESIGALSGDPTPGINSINMPGSPTFSQSAGFAYPEADDIQVPAGSPIASGPGGTLTQTSLDRIPPGGGGAYNMPHWFLASALPAGSSVLLTTSNAAHATSFGYSVGSGRVAYSDSQFGLFLPGGDFQNSTDSFKAGGIAYLTNLIAWAAGANSTTCASEGYTGTKLTWCKNICENGLTGATLDIWIHRWINRYRDLPYCAAEGGGEQPAPTLK
mgnify:FL=1